MALQPSVTVVEVTGDEDEEWGDEDEVVVWSKNSTDTQGSALDSDNVGVRGKQQGGHHPRGLLVASLANLAISYNVVRGRCPCSTVSIAVGRVLRLSLFRLCVHSSLQLTIVSNGLRAWCVYTY